MALDPLNYAEEALKCEYALVELAAGRVSSYSVAGRSFTKNDMGALRALAEYFRQRHAETTGSFVTGTDLSEALQ